VSEQAAVSTRLQQGRFSEGQETLPPDLRVGRFSDGQETLHPHGIAIVLRLRELFVRPTPALAEKSESAA
jgi:hypothetical protein